jgi:hypothetical protein
MINFNSTSNLLILISILTFGILFFVGLAIPDRHEIISFGYDTSFLVLIIGYILRQKNIQQLIGLFLYLGVYNLDIFSDNLFQIQNATIFYFARHNTFYLLLVSFAFLLPTLFDKYKFAPLTNRTNIKDSTIILTSIFMTILIQTTIRLTA